MKKLITVAALLAAGTALSNAAETFVFSTEPTTTTSGGSYKGFAFTLSEDDARLLWDDADSGEAFPEQFSLSSIAFDWRNTVRSSDVYTRTITLTDSSNIVLASDRKAWSGASPITLNCDSVTVNAGESYYVYISTSQTVEVGKAFTDGSTLSGIPLAAVGFGTTTGNNGLHFISGTAGGVQDDNYAPSVRITASAVPEPSAFGLLAGIGALALVAARRRRK